jgi:hypothetical protein
MDGNMAPHFHIRWIIADRSRIDWEAFANRNEAENMAKRLASSMDTYAIEEFNDSCERCAMFRLERNISNYPNA